MMPSSPSESVADRPLTPSSDMGTGLYRTLTWGLWILLLVSIPITSAPQIAVVLGENPVSPMALVPLIGIIGLWFVPYLARGGRLPAVSWPLLAFLAMAITSAIAAAALPIYPYKNQDIVSREVRALVTFSIGLGFFWTAAVFPRTEEELSASLRAVNIGGIGMLLWSTLQAWVALSGRTHVPLWITNAHHLLSIRDPLVDRVTGFAFEPSWLGDQLVILYLPLWLSAVLARSSSFLRTKGIFSVELGLFLWGTVILLLSKSRISLLSLGIVAVVLYVATSWRAAGGLARRLAGPSPLLTSSNGMRALRGALAAAALGGLLLVGIGGAVLAGKVDRRLRHLSTLPDLLNEIRHYYPNDVAYGVADRLAFAERVVYWADGFRVFEQYPILGVGPGNAGFFFVQSLPVYGYSLEEIEQIITPLNAAFPNPKNLWARLLAETGVAGFAVFTVWLGIMMLLAWRTWRRASSPVLGMMGLAGLLALLAQLGEGFSLDSFALPQLWVMLGLLTAAARRVM